jgi:hypothetical protein
MFTDIGLKLVGFERLLDAVQFIIYWYAYRLMNFRNVILLLLLSSIVIRSKQFVTEVTVDLEAGEHLTAKFNSINYIIY